MTYEIYRYIFICGAVLAVGMFIISVLVFFLLDIPSVVGNISGASEKKGIESIRNQSKNYENKNSQSYDHAKDRGRITDKISPSGNIIKNPSASIEGVIETEKISSVRLSPANETTVLTGELSAYSPETTVLSEETVSDETTLLDTSSGFVVEYEITYIHTDEVIA